MILEASPKREKINSDPPFFGFSEKERWVGEVVMCDVMSLGWFAVERAGRMVRLVLMVDGVADRRANVADTLPIMVEAITCDIRIVEY